MSDPGPETPTATAPADLDRIAINVKPAGAPEPGTAAAEATAERVATE